MAALPKQKDFNLVISHGSAMVIPEPHYDSESKEDEAKLDSCQCTVYLSLVYNEAAANAFVEHRAMTGNIESIRMMDITLQDDIILRMKADLTAGNIDILFTLVKGLKKGDIVAGIIYAAGKLDDNLPNNKYNFEELASYVILTNRNSYHDELCVVSGDNIQKLIEKHGVMMSVHIFYSIYSRRKD